MRVNRDSFLGRIVMAAQGPVPAGYRQRVLLEAAKKLRENGYHEAADLIDPDEE
jgi:hypothetical protein